MLVAAHGEQQHGAQSAKGKGERFGGEATMRRVGHRGSRQLWSSGRGPEGCRGGF